MPNKALRLVSGSEEETRAMGRKLGELAGAGATVCLYGELGAGKTVFVKGFASAFGIEEKDIGSASFVIVAEYDTTPPFYHVDLYRLEGEEALDSVGIWDYLEGGGTTVIEWSERLGPPPEGALKVTIAYAGGSSREISMDGVSEEDWHNLQNGKT